jgi:nucleotide-binding universal stress UspA family protein
MVAPREIPDSLGTRICLAWNGTAEAADAAGASIQWMQKADAVRILVADEYHRPGPTAEELVDYIALHDVKAELHYFNTKERDIGAGLLVAAAEFESDLLAMGAYSHSRLRQLILGGVTRHVLEHAALPVLMSR